MRAIKRLRMLMIAVWVLMALLVVGSALAQDGNGTPQQETQAANQAPQDLDDIAVKLTPLLVGAALIERTLEFLFNWVERAILDASHTMHSLLARVAGLVEIDVRNAWQSVTQLSSALSARAANPMLALNDPDSPNPEDWPLALLEERLEEARDLFEKAQQTIESALSSPLYVARKKVAAMVLSMAFGITLSLIGSIRLFQPLGVNVASWIDAPFRIFDMVLAGVLMGLGTDWVHQVIGLLVNGKGLLGRAATGSTMDPEQVATLASVAVQENLGQQLDNLRSQVLGVTGDVVAAGTRTVRRIETITEPAPTEPAPETTPAGEALASDAPDVPFGPAAASGINLANMGVVGGMATARPAAPATPETVAPEREAATPEGFLPLGGISVTVGEGGTSARAEPSLEADTLATLPEGTRRETDGLVFGEFTWLRTPWEGPEADDAWIPGEETDFPRSAAYNEVSGAWYESAAVVAFRRSLVRDLLRVRGANRERLAEVDTLSGEALEDLEVSLTRETIPPLYHDFWAMQLHLGLPDPLAYLPVQTSPPAGIEAIGFHGFGPTTYALDNWMVEFEQTRGLHPGVDYLVPEGTPLIAVADGVIVDFPFLPDPAARSIALRPFLPEKYVRADGSRVLSNIVIGYGHVSDGAPIVQIGQEVRAGEIIGSSAWPRVTLEDGTVFEQRNNAHLHLEVHFVTDGTSRLDASTPVNPLMLFTPRLVAWQARLATQHNGPAYPSDGQPFGRLGFFSLGAFSFEPDTIVWNHQVTRSEPWPEGVYPLDGLIEWGRSFEPYPLDGSSEF